MKGLKYLVGVTALAASLYGCVGANRQVYGLNGQSTTFEGTREPEGNRMVDGLKGKKVDMPLEEACNAEIESYTNKTEEFINKPGFQGFPDDY